MLVDAPAAGFGAEIGDDRPRLSWNVPSPLLERDVHAGVAEADDVGAAVAGDVGEEAWMLVDAPAAGLEAEIREHGLRLERERAVAVAQRDVHAGVAEARRCRRGRSPVQVGEQARMLVDAPAAGSKPKSAMTNCGGWNVPSPLPSAT